MTPLDLTTGRSAASPRRTSPQRSLTSSQTSAAARVRWLSRGPGALQGKQEARRIRGAGDRPDPDAGSAAGPGRPAGNRSAARPDGSEPLNQANDRAMHPQIFGAGLIVVAAVQ